MLIGYLGDIAFKVTEESVLTFHDFTRQGSGRWTEHAIVGAKPILEFIGGGLETITFTMYLSTDLGVSPITVLKKLRELRDDGTPVSLLLDSKMVTDNFWILESINETVNHWGRDGAIQSVSVGITLKEYVTREGTA